MPTLFIFGDPEKLPNYGMAVAGVGGEFFYAEDAAREPEAYGLILTGGGDVDPSFYGQENTASAYIDADLDRREFAVIEAFLRAGKPILGICRGHQILNVALGGTLIQHIPTAPAHVHTEAGDSVHSIEALPGSLLHTLYGHRFSVNSSHHQAVEKLAPGLALTAQADDGVAEAFEDPARRLWGVQFHPERMCFTHRREDTVDGASIFRFFLEQCGANQVH